MRHAIPLLLEADTISFVDAVVKKRSREQDREVSRSEVVESMIQKYWINIRKQQANMAFDKKVAAKVK